MSLEKMLKDAQKLSNKYSVIIELDFKYTADNSMDITMFKQLKNKEPEVINPTHCNNKKLSDFIDKYLWSEFLKFGDYYKIIPK